MLLPLAYPHILVWAWVTFSSNLASEKPPYVTNVGIDCSRETYTNKRGLAIKLQSTSQKAQPPRTQEPQEKFGTTITLSKQTKPRQDQKQKQKQHRYMHGRIVCAFNLKFHPPKNSHTFSFSSSSSYPKTDFGNAG